MKIYYVILEFFFQAFKIIIYLKDVIFWVFMKIFENTVEIISNIDFGKILKKISFDKIFLKKPKFATTVYIYIF